MRVARVTFRPTGHEVDVEVGTTLFEAGGKANASVETACVGKGTCGLCRVKVLQGEASLSPYTDEETRHIGNIYHLTKLRLACRTRVLGEADVVVEVIPRRRPATKPQNLVRK